MSGSLQHNAAKRKREIGKRPTNGRYKCRHDLRHTALTRDFHGPSVHIPDVAPTSAFAHFNEVTAHRRPRLHHCCDRFAATNELICVAQNGFAGSNEDHVIVCDHTPQQPQPSKQGEKQELDLLPGEMLSSFKPVRLVNSSARSASCALPHTYTNTTTHTKTRSAESQALRARHSAQECWLPAARAAGTRGCKWRGRDRASSLESRSDPTSHHN